MAPDGKQRLRRGEGASVVLLYDFAGADLSPSRNGSMAAVEIIGGSRLRRRSTKVYMP